MKYRNLFITILLFFSCSNLSRTGKFIPDLKLGQPNLNQTVITSKIKKGVTYYQIERGETNSQDYYVLSSGVLSESKFNLLGLSLRDSKITYTVVSPPEKGPNGYELGKIIHVGEFSDLEGAEKAKISLRTTGLNFSIRHTSEDGNATTGPFSISLLKINLNTFDGSIISALGQKQVKGKQKTSAIAYYNKALAAVNGGFFAWTKQVGVPGDLAGLSIIDGVIESEATEGRGALLIKNGKKTKVDILDDVSTDMWIIYNGKRVQLQGKNRLPGKVLNCGNRHDPVLTKAAHDYVCENENELVIIDRSFGNTVTLDSGKVVAVQNGIVLSEVQLYSRTSVSIPENGFLLNGIGTAQKNINTKAGDVLGYDENLRAKGIDIAIKTGDFAFNGGPRLVRDGNILYDNRGVEGWAVLYPELELNNKFVDENDDIGVSQGRAGFYHSWIVRRHPRTAVGLTENNELLLVTVYGRQPGYSAGATITEMAKLLQSLGAVDAFNLDGGGSSMMVVNGRTTGISSDVQGEREVGDALLILSETN
jgi:exopolysaccharide biosynthesis protein